jgi:hypothetical protein
MKRHALGRSAAFAAVLGSLALIPTLASGGTHDYPVTVTIQVDRPQHLVKGEVISDAPASFCTQATVRVRRVASGHDPVLARKFPNDLAQWRYKVPARLAGKRLYAEVSTYNLPSRPVTCLGDRSRTVTAP